MGTLRIGNDVVVPLLVQEGGGQADTSGNLVLMPNLGVPQRSGGLCTSKEQYSFDEIFLIHIVSKYLYTGNIYSSNELFKLQMDAQNYFVLEVIGYDIFVRLVLNNTVVKEVKYAGGSSDLFVKLQNSTDNIITLDYHNKRFIVKTKDRNNLYDTPLDMDLSDWDLDSLSYFNIITEFGKVYSKITANKFVLLNQYINYNEWLDEILTADNYSPFPYAVSGTKNETNNFTMRVGGTRVETISTSHVINSFNQPNFTYFAMGAYTSIFTASDLGCWMITKVKFTDVTSEVQIGSGAGVIEEWIFDEDYNLVWQSSTSAGQRFKPESDKWYIMQAQADASTINGNIGYVSNYAYYLTGAGKIEIEAIGVGYPRKGNIGSINWNGTYFTGDIPFAGKNIQFNKTSLTYMWRIPLYQQKIENGNIYMWNGTVWKQISS